MDTNNSATSSAESREDRSAEVLEALKRHLSLTLGKDRFSATLWDLFEAAAYASRDELIKRWLITQQQYYLQDVKRVYYLSMEFLIGRALGNALLNLGLDVETQQALARLGYELEEVADQEPDAGLGNGGLGRLAACFLDSMATLELPAYGYGLRYEFGIFHQKIKDGYQVEEPDNWLAGGNPWEICRPEAAMTIGFGGRVEGYQDEAGGWSRYWVPAEEVIALPYDTPIPGYRNGTVNTLRLWSARASTNEFDLEAFNEGAYIEAVEDRALAENITKILYPNDQMAQGRELRLRQQYFMTSATLQDILRRYLKYHADFGIFAEKVAIQLNDTHPAVAIPELMRLLMDVQGLSWDHAWSLTSQVFAYTNHTLLEEALEKWGVDLFERLLPRHLEIIYEINTRFLRQVATKFPGDLKRLSRMSLIAEGGHRQVRMAYLAIVASHSVNGVAKLHTDLLTRDLVRDFHEMYPERFNSKTNGITQRRWLLLSNPELSALITEAIGDGWIRDLSRLSELRPHAEDAAFREKWRAIKRSKKEALAALIQREVGLEANLDAMFAVQIKRIHEYKRQLLNILYVVTRYLRLKSGQPIDDAPRLVLIGGKAAPGYVMAKRIIKLIGAVSEVINNDPEARGLLQVVFLPNYRVSQAEIIIPASELSEQISTAGKEASGTGNMKLALNGALTIGTLDGANIEMKDEIGGENMFIFGHTVEEIRERKAAGYDPRAALEEAPELKRALELIAMGHFSIEDPGLFRPIVDALLSGGDPYMVIADFNHYADCQQRVSEAYKDPEEWTRKSILNVAGIGYFSSDRTIQEYADEIWRLKPCPIKQKQLDWGDEVPEAAQRFKGARTQRFSPLRLRERD